MSQNYALESRGVSIMSVLVSWALFSRRPVSICAAIRCLRIRALRAFFIRYIFYDAYGNLLP